MKPCWGEHGTMLTVLSGGLHQPQRGNRRIRYAQRTLDEGGTKGGEVG